MGSYGRAKHAFLILAFVDAPRSMAAVPIDFDLTVSIVHPMGRGLQLVFLDTPHIEV